MGEFLLHLLSYGLFVHASQGADPHFWTYSSCTKDSDSWISNSFHEGVRIKSWIQSIGKIFVFFHDSKIVILILVPTFDDSEVFTQLGSHFVQRRGIIKADLIVQYPERQVDKSICLNCLSFFANNHN